MQCYRNMERKETRPRIEGSISIGNMWSKNWDNWRSLYPWTVLSMERKALMMMIWWWWWWQWQWWWRWWWWWWWWQLFTKQIIKLALSHGKSWVWSKTKMLRLSFNFFFFRIVHVSLANKGKNKVCYTVPCKEAQQQNQTEENVEEERLSKWQC